MVCSKLSPAADMDIDRQLIHITAELILVVRRVKFCEADLQIEIVFGPGRSDGRQRLIKKTPTPLGCCRVCGTAAPVSHVHGPSHRSPAHLVVIRAGSEVVKSYSQIDSYGHKLCLNPIMFVLPLWWACSCNWYPHVCLCLSRITRCRLTKINSGRFVNHMICKGVKR